MLYFTYGFDWYLSWCIINDHTHVIKVPFLSKQENTRHSELSFDDEDYRTCYQYWADLKGLRWAPNWRDWQWMDLPSHIIPYFIVVDVSHAPLDFTYRFWGSAYAAMHSIEMTNKSVRDIRSPVTAKAAFEQYKEIVDSKQAMSTLDTIQAGPHDIIHTQTTLRMPMSDDGVSVDKIITFADWRKEHDIIKNEYIRAFGSSN